MSDSHFKVGKLYKNPSNVMVLVLRVVPQSELDPDFNSGYHSRLTYLAPSGLVGEAYFTKQLWEPVDSTG